MTDEPQKDKYNALQSGDSDKAARRERIWIIEENIGQFLSYYDFKAAKKLMDRLEQEEGIQSGHLDLLVARAIEKDRVDILEYAQQRNYDFNTGQEIALRRAVQYCAVDSVGFLVENGCDVNIHSQVLLQSMIEQYSWHPEKAERCAKIVGFLLAGGIIPKKMDYYLMVVKAAHVPLSFPMDFRLKQVEHYNKVRAMAKEVRSAVALEYLNGLSLQLVFHQRVPKSLPPEHSSHKPWKPKVLSFKP